MFGTASVSHEWDTIAFGLSTIPGIAALLLVVAAYWEQWRNRLPTPRARDPIAVSAASDVRVHARDVRLSAARHTRL
jgi:hypothetical protein